MAPSLPSPIPLTWNEALSGIFGSVSLASWIFLLVPQLIENYRLGSADGISLTFLLIWFLGDVTNLAGALWAGLVPTVIALAVYFCFADVTLIAQCLYYNKLKQKRDAEATESSNGHIDGTAGVSTEHTPLLDNGAPVSPNTFKRRRTTLTDVTDENLGLPGSRRPSTVRARRSTTSQHPPSSGALTQILEEPTRTRAWMKNTLSILLIIAAGAAGWALAWKAGAWRPTPAESGNGGGKAQEKTPIGAEILGYASAVLYLGARIPQIVKNQRERSCEGLSLLFFLLSVVGNATYGAGILFHSLERQYVLTNLPWLIGSWGTMAEDAVIFVQFSVFGDKGEEGKGSGEEMAVE